MDFEIYKMKSYKYWGLYLHVHQYPYIGRAYVWSNNDESSQLSEMTKEERDELFDEVIPDWLKAVEKVFKPDMTNYAMLANNAKHLHWHLIPRYEKPREFMNIEFIDKRYGHNYKPHESRDLPEDVLMAIKEALIAEINKG